MSVSGFECSECIFELELVLLLVLHFCEFELSVLAAFKVEAFAGAIVERAPPARASAERAPSIRSIRSVAHTVLHSVRAVGEDVFEGLFSFGARVPVLPFRLSSQCDSSLMVFVEFGTLIWLGSPCCSAFARANRPTPFVCGDPNW